MFQRLAYGMAENQKALNFILQDQNISAIPKAQHKDVHQSPSPLQTQHQDVCNDDVNNLSSVLRRASELCYINISSEEEDSEVDEGIFLIDDL